MSVYPQQMQGRRELPWHRWQDWVSLILGIWLFIAPWVLGMTAHASSREFTAAWDSWIVGVIFVVFSLCALSNPKAMWAEAIELIASVWLFIAPWVLGYVAVGHSAAVNSWVIAVIVFVLTIWSLNELRSDTTTSSTRSNSTGTGQSPTP